MTARVLPQTLDGGPRHRLEAEATGELAELGRAEARQAQSPRSRRIRGKAGPRIAEPCGLVRARRGEDEDLVESQPAHRERQRLRRREIDPLEIVDDHHHRAHLLERAQHPQQLRPHRQRIGVRCWPRPEQRQPIELPDTRREL